MPKLYLPHIITEQFEKMEQIGMSLGACSRLTGMQIHSLTFIKKNPERVTIANAQKIINAVYSWQRLQKKAIVVKKD